MARQPAVEVFEILKAFKSPFYRTVLTIPFSTRFLSRLRYQSIASIRGYDFAHKLLYKL